MAAAVRAVTTLALGNRTTSTWTPPTGLANDDILIAIFVTGRNPAIPTITAPSGFVTATGLPISVNKGAGYQLGQQVFWKTASGESGNYDFTHSAADTEGVMYAISGADTVTPLNPVPSTNNGTGTTTTALGITTDQNSSVVIYVNTTWDDANPSGTPTGTTPTFGSRYSPLGAGVTFLADGVLATAGATGNKTGANGNGGANPWMGLLVAVNASSGGASGEPAAKRMGGVPGAHKIGGAQGGAAQMWREFWRRAIPQGA